MKSLAPRSTARRRTAVLAILLAPALAACGFGAQTDQIYQPAQGVNDRSTNVWILNATVVAGEDGAGTFAGTFANKTGTAENLTNVTADGVTPGGKGVTIGGYQSINMALPGRDGGPQLSLTGASIKPGYSVKLTFTFSGGGTATVNVPVVSNDPQDGDEYQNVPLPSPTPTDDATTGTEG